MKKKQNKLSVLEPHTIVQLYETLSLMYTNNFTMFYGLIWSAFNWKEPLLHLPLRSFEQQRLFLLYFFELLMWITQLIFLCSKGLVYLFVCLLTLKAG